MKKDLVFPIIIAITAIVVIALFVVLIKLSHPALPDGGLTFFYSAACPHCAKVEEFFIANNIDAKISIKKVDINGSTENSKLFFDASKTCGVTKAKDMGVPLLLDGATCVNGDEPIINYFKDKLDL